MKLFTLIVTLLLALAFTGCGGSDDCKDACTKLSGCGFKSSGLSCDSDCDQGDCAACIDDKSCDEIFKGDCANDCPGVAFTKK